MDRYFFDMFYISKYKHKPNGLFCSCLQTETLSLLATKIATGWLLELALTTFSAYNTSVWVIQPVI